jgi:hypothetical protein
MHLKCKHIIKQREQPIMIHAQFFQPGTACQVALDLLFVRLHSEIIQLYYEAVQLLRLCSTECDMAGFL